MADDDWAPATASPLAEVTGTGPRPQPQVEVLGYADMREVARGGDSIVYRARQVSVDRDVAIKVMQTDDPDDVARFERELAITVRLGRQHPYIVTVLDTTTTTAGQPCLVMEFHDLGSLHDRLREHGPLPVSDVVAAGTSVADALAFAHAHGVLHRDVKPQNVLLLPTSYVLSDFGIARMADAGHTSTLERFSYRHASPQVLDGLPPTEADDLWSLGSTLFTVLDGRAPFAALDPDDDTALSYLRRVRTHARRELRRDDVPAELVELVEACLQPGREQRLASAAEAVRGLRRIRTEDRSWQPAPDGRPEADAVTRPRPQALAASGEVAASSASATAPADPAAGSAAAGVAADSVGSAAAGSADAGWAPGALAPAGRGDGPPRPTPEPAAHPAPVAPSALAHVEQPGAVALDGEGVGTAMAPDADGTGLAPAEAEVAPAPTDRPPATWRRVAAFLAGVLLVGAAIGAGSAVLRGMTGGSEDPASTDPVTDGGTVPSTDAPPTPDGPVNIEVSDEDLEPQTPALADNGTSVTLTWSEPPTAVDFYVVLEMTSEEEARTVGGVVVPPASSATVEGLDPDDAELCFRVMGLVRQDDGQVGRGVSEPVCRGG